MTAGSIDQRTPQPLRWSINRERVTDLSEVSKREHLLDTDGEFSGLISKCLNTWQKPSI